MAFVIKVFNIIIGLFIICYVFYMRVLKIRMPRDLNMFNPVMQYGLILIACTWLLTSLYIIIKSSFIVFLHVSVLERLNSIKFGYFKEKEDETFNLNY